MESSQEFGKRYSIDNKTLRDRYNKTIKFLCKHIAAPASILDLGIVNPFTQVMSDKGFTITNTEMGLDLDTHYASVETENFDVVTAFEIFEHLVAPYNILNEIKSQKLVASVPLNLWFTKAYWNKDDPWDRHYHEFEPRQFDMVLEKAGWQIIDSELWTSKSYKLGIRPLLRSMYPRYYIVYCQRKND